MGRFQYRMLGIALGASLVCLSGCTDLMVLTGFRVRLKDTPVQSIQAHLLEGPAMYPGQAANLIVSVAQPNGPILQTEGAGQGTVLWEDIHIEPNLVAYDAQGHIFMSPDPVATQGKLPSITLTVPSHPGVSTTLNIPLRYDAPFVADFSGRPGAPGYDGLRGANGRDGKDGSTDPAHSSAGGDGGDGHDGESGGNGGPGENALPVLVQVALQPGSPPMLQAQVSNGLKTERFLVDPHGGTLLINAEGGAGGSGGHGGHGGSGGRGGKGSPSGHRGLNGYSGRDGMPGPPGWPGPIKVEFSPKAQAYLPMIRFVNRYGPQPGGPPPVFEAKTIGPLW